jgi:membrane protein
MGVFGAITSAINHAWRVERQPGYFKHKLVSFLMLLAAGLLLATALLIVSAIDVVRASWSAEVLTHTPGLRMLGGLGARSASILLSILVVGLIFYFVPNTRLRFRDVWVGAALTGLLWSASLAGFSWYVRDLSRYRVVHGSIAAVVVFLIWVYTSSAILIFGAEVTAAYGRLRARRS